MARMTATGDELLQVGAVPVGLDLDAADNSNVRPNAAVITVESGSIRYRLSGQNPGVGLGHILQAGDELQLVSQDEVQRFRAVQDGGPAVLFVTRYIW